MRHQVQRLLPFIYFTNKDHRTIGALRMARAIYNQAMKDELEISQKVKVALDRF